MASQTPARYVLFDVIVAPGGKSLVDKPLAQRWRSLEMFEMFAKRAGIPDKFALSPDEQRAAPAGGAPNAAASGNLLDP